MLKTENNKIIFLYDSLMNPKVQKQTRIPLKLLSYGFIKAKMYFLNDDKKKRYFVIPPVSKPHSRQYNIYVYGGIYLMSDFKEYSNALYSFYNCSLKYINKITEQDLYIPSLYSIKPIKFNTLDDIDNCTYSKLDNIEGLVMLGNQNNQLVKKSINKGRYYRHNNGIDAVSFLASLES